MNSLSIHNIEKIQLSEIHNLTALEPVGIKPSYSMSIYFTYNNKYIKSTNQETFELVLFSNNKKILEEVKLNEI